jgi:tetratricopeptide (TPR) repeat protein
MPVAAALIALMLLPAAYTATRCERATSRLRDLLEQVRLEDSRQLTAEILALDPAARLDDRSVRRIGQTLESQVADLKRVVAVALPPTSSIAEQVERARQLAILNQTGAALELLAPLVDRPQPVPEACLLRGTILQAADQWIAAREAYEQALSQIAISSSAPTKTSMTIAATREIAYCERKQGHYKGAEAAYLTLLDLSPDAGTHSLLAQFYEDTQQAERAGRHARQAMSLDPARYRARGESLIDQLIVRQFGCFAVRASEDSTATSR